MASKQVEIARKLRKNMTVAERKLWHNVRGRNFQGIKFRRQEPTGHDMVDFVCYEKKLISEADGGQHNEFREHDIPREKWLEEQGFTILRFWNNEILNNINGVLLSIKEHLEGQSLTIEGD